MPARWWWGVPVVVGAWLIYWSRLSLPPGTAMQPVPIRQRTTRGPYRWLSHPMYVGNWLYIVGFAGLAAGFWNALAVGTVAELLLRDWAGREDGDALQKQGADAVDVRAQARDGQRVGRTYTRRKKTAGAQAEGARAE